MPAKTIVHIFVTILAVIAVVLIITKIWSYALVVLATVVAAISNLLK